MYVLESPNGYRFYVADEQSSGDSVENIIINSNDLPTTKAYWTDFLGMQLVKQTDTELVLSYGEDQTNLIFKKYGENHYLLNIFQIYFSLLLLLFIFADLI